MRGRATSTASAPRSSVHLHLELAETPGEARKYALKRKERLPRTSTGKFRAVSEARPERG